jgi:hypothetical protein
MVRGRKKKVEIEIESKGMTLDFTLDEWQKEILEATGNICLCIGRQSGKSEIIAIKTAEYICNNPKKKVLIISITEDQAQRMLQKIIMHIYRNYPKMIAGGRDKTTNKLLKPTQHEINLTNKSQAITRAVGQYGLGVLGMTVDVVVPDEAAYLPEAIWTAITPMLLTTGGSMWLLSTPNMHQGYFYDAYTKPEMGFKTFYHTSEEVAEKRPEPQRSIMLQHLEREKARMTELEYAQQYKAQFLEELNQLFPDELIKQSQSLQRCNSISISNPIPEGTYYLGVDVARMGGDETTFEVFEQKDGIYLQRENIINKYTYTTQTIDKILELDRLYHFRKIYIDDGGLGAAVLDQLLDEDQTKRKVVAINNSSKALDHDENRKRKILKEDLYLNLKRMLERGKVKLLNDPEILISLKSVVLENSKTGEVRIYGRYTHIVEGIIRAIWADRDKHLNIYCYTL